MKSGNAILGKRYTFLAIVAALLLALLAPLGSYMIWILGGAVVYFVFLVIYHSPRSIRDKSSASQAYRSATGERAQSNAPLNSQQKRKVRLIIFLIATIVIMISVFIGIIGLQSEADANTDRQTLASNPNNLDALTNLGNQFFANQQYDSALYYYNRVLAIDAENSSGLFNKSLVYYQQQQYEQSIAILKKCVTLYPDYGEAYGLLGDNYYVQDNNTEALTWYRKAYDKGLRTVEVLNILGYLCEQQNNSTEAIRFYKETLQQDSSVVEVYDRLIALEPAQAKKYAALAEKWR
jgi:tetratricopeptide (TPR) repeat protein